MLELLSGKASVDQIARRFGVRAATVEGWRDQALEGIGEAMRQGTRARSARELAQERDLASLEKAFTHLAIKHELVERGIRSLSPWSEAASLFSYRSCSSESKSRSL